MSKQRTGLSQRENQDKYQSVISEVEELRDLSGLSCWTGKNLLDICFTLCFNHKAKMVVVTVILTLVHIAVQCCS